MICTFPPTVVVLKPRDLDSPFFRKVECFKGSDNTLCGSRDAIGLLLVYLQEKRFGVEGLSVIYGRCVASRQYLCDKLTAPEVPFKMSRTSLDLVVYPAQPKTCPLQKCWGLVCLDHGGFLLSIQPCVIVRQVEALAEILWGNSLDNYDLALLRPIHPAGCPFFDVVSSFLHLTVKILILHLGRSLGAFYPYRFRLIGLYPCYQ